MNRDNLRKVLVCAVNEEAYFHQWVKGDNPHEINAIVEREDGKVALVHYSSIKFIS